MTSAADIYRAEDPDGTVRYASQAFDASYALYLKDDHAETDSAPTNTGKARVATKQTPLEPLIRHYARKHAVEEVLVRAVIEVESNFDTRAVSRKGAMGTMQLMPATAARYGVTRRDDPAQNIEAGVLYLKALLAQHNGNVALALASYNAGAGSVAKYGRRIPPYKETMLYVPAVLARLQAARNSAAPHNTDSGPQHLPHLANSNDTN
jgi:soluble lytic murein transglycosylase-like protein